MDKFNLDKCIKAVAKGSEQALKNLYDNYKNPKITIISTSSTRQALLRKCSALTT